MRSAFHDFNSLFYLEKILSFKYVYIKFVIVQYDELVACKSVSPLNINRQNILCSDRIILWVMADIFWILTSETRPVVSQWRSWPTTMVKHWTNVGLMLGQRLRRWPSIKPIILGICSECDKFAPPGEWCAVDGCRPGGEGGDWGYEDTGALSWRTPLSQDRLSHWAIHHNRWD